MNGNDEEGEEEKEEVNADTALAVKVERLKPSAKFFSS
jgi:hypothetical protein